MPTLISKATGNFTAAGTWNLCDSTSELDSEAASTASTTSMVASSTFTPGAISINALTIKLAARAASPTGTFTIELYNITSSAVVANTTTVIDVADMHSAGNGWYVFPTNGTVVLLAATGYAVRIKTSVNGEVTLYRNATANNWSRQLRTTTTQAPAANDKLLVAGEHTGAGTGNDFTVTMQDDTATSYGPTASGGPPDGMAINKRSTLSFGVVSGSANYLKIKGRLSVYGGGIFNIWDPTAVKPAGGATATLEFDSVANVDSGLNVPGGTFNAGYSDGPGTFWTYLNTDEAAAQTVLGVASTTGWDVGDSIFFPSTSRTSTQFEKRTIGTVDSGVQVTVTSGLTNAHSGTSPTQSEVGHLTRRVKIRGISASLQGYCLFQTTATVVCKNVEFSQLGSATANKRGIDCTTTTGSCSITRSSIHDSTVASSIGFIVTGAAASNITFSENVVYNIATFHFNVPAATSGTWTADGNLFVGNTSGVMVDIRDTSGTFTNNTIASSVGQGLLVTGTGEFGTWSGNTVHSCASNGIQLTSVTGGTISSLIVWRNNATGLITLTTSGVTFSNLTMFGNAVANIIPTRGVNLVFTGVTSSGDTTFSTPSGFSFSELCCDVVIESSDFGTVSGIKTAHTQDILCTANYATITLRNTKLASGTEVASQSLLLPGAYIRSQKHDQTAGLHKTLTPVGNITIDAAIFDVTPSVRLTPTSASVKLVTDGSSVDGKGAFRVVVPSGYTATVGVKVCESVAGDGTDYNGARPRLILRKNVAAGISADVVLDTATVASEGAFEDLVGTTAAVTDDAVLSFVVDCDGTTGWLNLDTWLPPVTTWTPAAIANLKLWLNAAQGTFQDAARTTPAVVDNDPVGGWQDLSGQASHAGQATAGNRPLLKLAVQNGKSVLRFDGTNDELTATLTSTPEAHTIFVVFQSTSAGSEPGIFSLGTANYNQVITHYSSGPTIYSYHGSGSIAVSKVLANSTWNVLTRRWTGGAAQADMDLWLDGVLASTKGGTPVNTGMGPTATIGNRVGGAAFMNGDIGAVLVYNRSLTTDERLAVEAYLKAEWGTP